MIVRHRRGKAGKVTAEQNREKRKDCELKLCSRIFLSLRFCSVAAMLMLLISGIKMSFFWFPQIPSSKLKRNRLTAPPNSVGISLAASNPTFNSFQWRVKIRLKSINYVKVNNFLEAPQASTSNTSLYSWFMNTFLRLLYSSCKIPDIPDARLQKRLEWLSPDEFPKILSQKVLLVFIRKVSLERFSSFNNTRLKFSRNYM